MDATRLNSIQIRKHAIRVIVLVKIRNHATWRTLTAIPIYLDLREGAITLVRMFLCHAIVLLLVIAAHRTLQLRTVSNGVDNRA